MSRRRKSTHRLDLDKEQPSPVEPSPVSQPPAAHNDNGATPPDVGAEAQVAALRAAIEELRRDFNARLDGLAAAVAGLAPEPEQPEPAAPAPNAAASVAPARQIRVGDEVYVPRLGGTHTVVAVAASGQTFKVLAGAMRVEVRRDELATPNGTRPAAGAAGRPRDGRPHLGTDIPEIDLHGFSERDALITLELFLHHAFAQRTPRVRVIHGKGNGVLRAAVRRELARSELVRSIDAGPEFRGDEGVTLAELDL